MGKRQTRSQVEEDAILAALLQDQMFMEDIRRNPEVYGFRRGQQPPRRGHPAAAPAAAAPAPDTATANAGDDGEEEQKDGEKKKTFKEKWNSLTDGQFFILKFVVLVLFHIYGWRCCFPCV